jgi:hypothetical protein
MGGRGLRLKEIRYKRKGIKFLVASVERDRGSMVQFPVEAGNFSLYHRFQTGSGANPASYPMGTGGSFPGGKAAGA